MVKYVLMSLLLFSTFPALAESFPYIQGNKLFFLKSHLNIVPKKILFEDPEQALKQGKPVYITEQAIVPPSRKIALIIREYHFYEGNRLELLVFSEKGKQINRLEENDATLKLLTAVDRILLNIQSEHYAVAPSTCLYDFTGTRLVCLGMNGYLRDFGTSEDQRLIWLAYNNTPEYTEFFVYDSTNGTEMLHRRYTKLQTVSLRFGEQDYRFTVPSPDYPG